MRQFADSAEFSRKRRHAVPASSENAAEIRRNHPEGQERPGMAPSSTWVPSLRLLKPSGCLFVAVPNAGGWHARTLGAAWGPLLCEEHSLALTAKFFERNLSALGFVNIRFTCGDDAQSLEALQDPSAPELDGEELIVVADKEE